jgi:hypothetical protein
MEIKMKKNTVKLLLVISLLSSIALADDGDMGNGTRLCGDLGNGTCHVSPVNEKDPIIIKNDENNRNSTNIITEWFNDILVEFLN